MFSFTGHEILSSRMCARALAENVLKPLITSICVHFPGLGRASASMLPSLEDLLDLYAESTDPKSSVVSSTRALVP